LSLRQVGGDPHIRMAAIAPLEHCSIPATSIVAENPETDVPPAYAHGPIDSGFMDSPAILPKKVGPGPKQFY
jgi:hypothetical protein